MQAGHKNKETVHDLSEDKSLEGFVRPKHKDWQERLFVNTKIIMDRNP